MYLNQNNKNIFHNSTYFIELLGKSDWLRESSRDLLCYLILFLNIVHHVVNIINIPVRWAR